MRRWPPTRCGGSAAAGGSRAPRGSAARGGVGGGWAFQSAEWLVDETGDALLEGADLDAALERYRKVHRKRLAPHHVMLADISSGRPMNALERRLGKVAAHDPGVRRAFEAVGSRRELPTTILRPRVLAHLIRG